MNLFLTHILLMLHIIESKSSKLVGLLSQTMQAHISLQVPTVTTASYDIVIDMVVEHMFGVVFLLVVIQPCQCR